MTRSFTLIGCFTIFWLGCISFAQAGALLSDLENALMCKCDDKCGKVLINCTCDTADETRKTLQSKLDSGLTVEQIVQSYVDQYGETVLSAPTKTGFNLTAWLTPFAALIGGGLGVRQIIKTWLNIHRRNDESQGVSEIEEQRNRYTRQLQKELDNLEA